MHRNTKRHNTHWIETYLRLVAPRTEAPEKFHFWVAVVTIAGVLRRCVYMPQGHFNWYPNWFVVLVAPPGVSTKSTTIDMGISLLRSVPSIKIGADCSSWQELLQSIEESREDVTLPDYTFIPMSAITMGIGELGTFLDPRDYNMVNILTELWDCRDVPFKKKTKTQGDNTIINPFVNFVAGTTPSWLNMNFKDYFGGWGFSSRVIMLHGNRKSKVIPYPSKVWGPGGFERAAQEAHLVDDLIHMRDTMAGPYELAPDALEWGSEWYWSHVERMETFNNNPLSDPWLMRYFARKQSHVHKLAIILAASQRDELVITRADLQTAVERCDEVEDEMTHIFGQANPDKGSAAAQDILKVIRHMANTSLGIPTEQEIYRYTIRTMDGGTAKSAIDYLVSAHYVTRKAGTDKLGRACTYLVPTEEAPTTPDHSQTDTAQEADSLGQRLGPL